MVGAAVVHYVAMFAVFEPTKELSEGRVLLAFSPFDDEMDLGSQSMFDFIADTLERFHRPWEVVLFLVGDNCSANQSLGSRSGIPFIGCASHRFNLAVKLFLDPHDALVAKANSLMKRLTTIKGRACLNQVSPLRARIRNDTRWSSSFEMLKRCGKILPALRLIQDPAAVACGLNGFMLSVAEGIKAAKLLTDLSRLNPVTIKLQDETLTIAQVRTLFDHVIDSYPVLAQYLSPKSAIVNNPAFESGLVKLQNGGRLTATEKATCSFFISGPTDPPTDATAATNDTVRAISFAGEALKKRRVCDRQADVYADTAYVPPTSNL